MYQLLLGRVRPLCEKPQIVQENTEWTLGNTTQYIIIVPLQDHIPVVQLQQFRPLQIVHSQKLLTPLKKTESSSQQKSQSTCRKYTNQPARRPEPHRTGGEGRQSLEHGIYPTQPWPLGCISSALQPPYFYVIHNSKGKKPWSSR